MIDDKEGTNDEKNVLLDAFRDSSSAETREEELNKFKTDIKVAEKMVINEKETSAKKKRMIEFKEREIRQRGRR